MFLLTCFFPLCVFLYIFFHMFFACFFYMFFFVFLSLYIFPHMFFSHFFVKDLSGESLILESLRVLLSAATRVSLLSRGFSQTRFD